MHSPSDHILIADDEIQKIVHYTTMHGMSSKLPVDIPSHVEKATFMEALREVSKTRAHDARDEYMITKKRSWRYLGSGFVFLIFCLLVGHVAQQLLGPSLGIGRLIEESATVAGWVGMWRPVEMFLYELPELKRKQELYQEIQQHIARLGGAGVGIISS